MEDPGWKTIDFIATNVRAGVKNFAKATEEEVSLIEDFNRKLQARLTTHVEISFVERISGIGLCFYPTIKEKGIKRRQREIAEEVAEELHEESRCGIIVRYFEKRVPRKNLYLLFNSAQALQVALNIQNTYLAREEPIFLASLELAHSEKRNPQYLIELLCMMSHHYRVSTRWRTGLLCLEHAEVLIEAIGENLDALSITPKQLVGLAEQVGFFYYEFDSAEKGIALVTKTLTTLERKLGLQEGALKDYVDTSDWKDDHETLWVTHETFAERFQNLAGLVSGS